MHTKKHLEDISTTAPDFLDKDNIKDETDLLVEKIDNYQNIMYAQGKYSLLIILQGMDASGKDGAVRHIFSGVNPMGCSVVSFKGPTEEELAHDYLRRIHQHTPKKWMIQIFNRSHYEDILVPTVEELLPQEVIDKRYEHINNFEKLLTDHDTIVLKFYLHISSKEQKKRLKERMEDPHKYWKHNDDDRDSRKKWDDYMDVYDTIFARCNEIPRHIIPSDDNRYKVNQIAKVIVETFEGLDLKWPDLETDDDDDDDKA